MLDTRLVPATGVSGARNVQEDIHVPEGARVPTPPATPDVGGTIGNSLPLEWKSCPSCQPFQVAREKLAALLEQRQRYYENADVVVTLEGYGRDAEGGAPTAAVMYRLLSAINEKVQAKKREQAERMNFRIDGADQLRNMRVMEIPAAAGAASQQGEPEAPQAA
jgi:hypothetical protein